MTGTIPDVPIPAGVAKADNWQDVPPVPYRVLFGELRNIDGGSNTQPSKPPQSSSPMGGSTTAACMRRRASISATTSSPARMPANSPPLLVEAADEIDLWAEQHQG